MRRVVITGYEAITPAGIGSEALWNSVRSGQNRMSEITRFDSSKYQSRIAGEVNEYDPLAHMEKRLAKKTDRFTHLALSAVKLALEHAELDLDNLDMNRTGVMVGNVLGGWDFAEKELRNLWTGGSKEVSPYQATAWFPAAPQGNICIKFGFKGRARTYISDRASGAVALIEGVQTILRDQADVILAGGTEAPLSPYAWLCLQTSGFLVRGSNTNAYRPFDKKHNGCAVGEGSSFVVLEEMEHAIKRGAKIYGEIKGWSITNDAYYPYATVRPDGKVLARSISASLKRADISPEHVDLLFVDGSAIPSEDATEIYAIREAFGEYATKVPITTPKPSIGHLLGAATSTDLIIALLSMEQEMIPPIINLDEPAAGFDDLNLIRNQPRSHEIRTCLLNSRGMGGINANIVVSKV